MHFYVHLYILRNHCVYWYLQFQSSPTAFIPQSLFPYLYLPPSAVRNPAPTYLISEVTREYQPSPYKEQTNKGPFRHPNHILGVS